MLSDFTHPNVWTALKGSSLPIILYGMGNGADKVLDECQKRKINISGVMASDDFCRYQDFRGFTVKKQSDFEREYEDILIALCFGSSLPDVMAHIKNVGQQHTLLVPNVPVTGSVIADEAFFDQHKSEIDAAYDLLADESSRTVYKGALDFIYTGRPEYLYAIESDKSEVFSNILKPDNEAYLDLGAYRGDTVEEFLQYTNGYKSITAVEPNPKNHEKLSEYLKTVDNATALNMGISDTVGHMTVSRKSGRMPVLGDPNGIDIPVTTVDALDLSPTYIKVDIEGMESAMLKGAEHTLRTLKPKINLAAYHRSEDIFKLILQLNRINPDYKIYLRKHPYIPCWDLNIYAL